MERPGRDTPQEQSVETYRSEDEQVEALKRWWKDNGTSTLTAAAVAIALALGWQGWQKHQLQEQEVASTTYQTMLDAIQVGGDSIATARTMADTLKADFSGSIYAQLGALAKARLLLESGDLAASEAELRWVLDHKPSAEIAAVSRLRLARVLSARGERAAALALLNESHPEKFAMAWEEARGDVLLADGKVEEARAAYAKAVEAGRGGEASRAEGWLELKYQSLGGELSEDAEVSKPANDAAAAQSSEG